MTTFGTTDNACLNGSASAFGNRSSNVSHTSGNSDDELDRMPAEIAIPSAVGVTMLSIVATVGNVLTIYAFIAIGRPRTVNDMYILNLAITDLCIACISIPAYIVYSLYGKWPFGRVLCKTWLAADFTFCMEAVLTMLIISLDRLLYIKMGIHYCTSITPKLATFQLATSWVLAFLVYSPMIIWWDQWVGYSTVPESDCHVEFAYDSDVTAVTACIEFLLPAIGLFIINTAIYREIRWLIKRRRRIAPDVVDPLSICASVRQTGSGISRAHWRHRPGTIVDQPFRRRNTGGAHNSRTEAMKNDNNSCCVRHESVQDNMRDTHICDGCCQNDPNNELRIAMQDRGFVKAARSLAALVAAFVICWAPYTILTVIVSFCNDVCMNPIVYEFFYWWVWVKSAVNPFLNAYHNSKYRKTFRRLLACKCLK